MLEPDFVLIRLGRNIRRLRKSLRLTQELLATRAGLHRTYVCDVEKGCRNVSLLTLRSIAEVLGVSLAALCEGIDVQVLNGPTPSRGIAADPTLVASDPAMNG